MKLTLEGIEEAIAAIAQVGNRVHNRIGDNAAEALEPVAITARQLVPVRSGDLRDSIVVSNKFSEGAEFTGGRGVNIIYVGPLSSDVFYAWFLEFGTVYMAAQPFLIPAVDQNEALVFEILGKRVGADILEGT